MTTPMPASRAAVALLSEIVDDAGLFPPASLPIDEALAAHATARDGQYRWMLGRFLCTPTRLGEITDPLRIGLVVPAGQWVDALAGTTSGRCTIEAVEARLPDDDVALRAKELVDAAAGIGAEQAWLEVPWSEFPADRWPDALAAIAAAGAGAGLKVRCGGETADHVPAPSVLASIVTGCRDAGVRFKATAGLHHPFRHPDPSIGAVMHGFVNLGVAATLARHRGLATEDVAAVLSDDDASSFVVDGDRVAWRDLDASADEVADTRRSLFAGFGSCSFREPVDDLVAFGILPS